MRLGRAPCGKPRAFRRELCGCASAEASLKLGDVLGKPEAFRKDSGQAAQPIKFHLVICFSSDKQGGSAVSDYTKYYDILLGHALSYIQKQRAAKIREPSKLERITHPQSAPGNLESRQFRNRER